MRWPRLARTELRNAARTRSLFVAAVVFVALGGLSGYLGGSPGADLARTLPAGALAVMTFIVPVVALGFSYGAVVSPRERGSLTLLLGLPYSRRDVLLGTYAGRAAIVVLSVFVSFAALAVTAVLRGVLVSPLAVLSALATAAALGVAFTGVGVGVSAAVRSTQAAATLAFGLFLLVFFLWWQVPGVVAYVLNGLATPPEPPAWAPVFRSLNPVAAYAVLGNTLLPGSISTGVIGGAVGSPALAIGVLAGWASLPPVVGYLRFRGDDL
jgi:ABC-2 type transport system permease protein